MRIYANMKARIETVELRALGKTYGVRYIKANIPAGTVNFVASAADAVLYIQCRDPSEPPRRALGAALRVWLRAEAKRFLPDFLMKLAVENGFDAPSGVRIAFQRSRWGSRSETGVISLSALLLFFPPELLRHVALHELCHIRFMNHSITFQTLLSRLDQKAALNQALLRKANDFVPDWAIEN